MIGRVRRAVLKAIGRSPAPTAATASQTRRRSASSDADRRLEAARKRLKATIPPPLD